MEQYQPAIAQRRVVRTASAGLSSTKIILLIFACLLLGHLAIKSFFGSIVINGVGVLVVASIYYWVLFIKRDPMAFTLMLFVCSQFLYANNQGGLFNLAAFVVLIPYLLTRNYKEMRLPPDPVLITILLALFAMNTVGLIVRNPLGLLVRIQMAAAYSGFMLAFILASNLRLDPDRLKKMVTVIGFFVFYNFLVSINQHYSAIKFITPLLGLDEGILYAASNAFGTFRSASSNGQYAMLIYAFMVPLLSSTAARHQLNIKPIVLVGICFLCVSTTILANMRAAAAFVGLVTIFYSVSFGVFYRKSFRYTKYLNRFTVAIVVFLLAFGTVIGVQNIAEDFQEAASASGEDFETGEVLNRLGAWEYGLDLINRDSWIVGYGHGGRDSNLIATGAVKTATGLRGGGHLHNLYLMLPIIYGWLGTFAFMALFLIPVFRAFVLIRTFSFDNLDVVVNFGFFVSLGLLLLDEIKSGNIVQTINFAMVAFIWLGWAVAAQRTLKYNIRAKRISGQNKNAA